MEMVIQIFKILILTNEYQQVRRFVLFVVLLLVQGLVLNHIHLFDCATPLIYIILVLHFRRNQSKMVGFSPGAFPRTLC